MKPTNWTDRPTDAALEIIRERPTYYAGVAQHHAFDRGDGRGALFATFTPEGGVLTFYLSEGDCRNFFKANGGDWLRWYKREVRPTLRSYDPHREAVVLTRHVDGPKVTVISVTPEEV